LLIEDLLDVSRITGGKFAMNPEEVDMTQLINEILDRYRVEASRVKCELVTSLPEKLIGGWDRTRIEQVFINLLTNALKYAAGKPIYISLSSRDQKVFLSVKDSGIGIQLKDQAKIFERFERAVEPAAIGGLGLGLYISRKIVEAHGGAIRVESEPGKGANFIVELPLHFQDSSTAAA
jgi:signal transduction histidine kinase